MFTNITVVMILQRSTLYYSVKYHHQCLMEALIMFNKLLVLELVLIY